MGLTSSISSFEMDIVSEGKPWVYFEEFPVLTLIIFYRTVRSAKAAENKAAFSVYGDAVEIYGMDDLVAGSYPDAFEGVLCFGRSLDWVLDIFAIGLARCRRGHPCCCAAVGKRGECSGSDQRKSHC